MSSGAAGVAVGGLLAVLTVAPVCIAGALVGYPAWWWSSAVVVLTLLGACEFLWWTSRCRGRVLVAAGVSSMLVVCVCVGVLLSAGYAVDQRHQAVAAGESLRAQAGSVLCADVVGRSAARCGVPAVGVSSIESDFATVVAVVTLTRDSRVSVSTVRALLRQAGGRWAVADVEVLA